VGAGALGAGHFINHAFAHNNWGHHPFHGSFPHPYPGFRGWYGYGWYGPVFWPFAYDILFADLFWPEAYDYRSGLRLRHLWRLFWPYGMTISPALPPPRPGRVYGAWIPAVAALCAGHANREPPSRGDRPDQPELRRRQGGRQLADRSSEQVVTPTADQRALLDDLSNASLRAAQAIKEACPTSVAFAPTGRLDAMEADRGMVQAIDIVAPPLDKFYDSLTDEQKARLNAAGDQTRPETVRWRTAVPSATRPNGRASGSKRRCGPVRSRPSSMRSRRRWRMPPISCPSRVRPACRRRRRPA
jgi:hypothetical protein